MGGGFGGKGARVSIEKFKKVVFMSSIMVEKLETKTREPMFLSAPTAEDLRPTQTEQNLIQDLINWQESSARSYIPVGKPYLARVA